MIRTGSERGRLARAALGVAALLHLVAAAAAAQGVTLELRPRVGDTLRLRMDQTVETAATQRVRGEDSTVTMRRRLTVYSRSVALRADRHGATMLALSDSMVVTDDRGRTTRAGLGGTRAELHVAPDGATRVLDNSGMMTPEAAALVGQMPATLPREPVALGATWSHAAAVPIPGQLGAPTGKLHVTFRLDSLSRYGDVAYISMRGTVARPKSGAGGGATYESDGTVVGALEMDRRRGWLTSMRATITTRSAVTQTLGAQPVHVHTKITQWMRVLDPVDRE